MVWPSVAWSGLVWSGEEQNSSASLVAEARSSSLSSSVGGRIGQKEVARRARKIWRRLASPPRERVCIVEESSASAAQEGASTQADERARAGGGAVAH